MIRLAGLIWQNWLTIAKHWDKDGCLTDLLLTRETPTEATSSKNQTQSREENALWAFFWQVCSQSERLACTVFFVLDFCLFFSSFTVFELSGNHCLIKFSFLLYFCTESLLFNLFIDNSVGSYIHCLAWIACFPVFQMLTSLSLFHLLALHCFPNFHQSHISSTFASILHLWASFFTSVALSGFRCPFVCHTNCLESNSCFFLVTVHSPGFFHFHFCRVLQDKNVLWTFFWQVCKQLAASCMTCQFVCCHTNCSLSSTSRHFQSNFQTPSFKSTTTIQFNLFVN